MSADIAALPPRIQNKIDAGPGGCWEWRGYRQPNGYGRTHYGDRDWFTHRIAYVLLVGAIPDGLVIDHLCRNRACCNPSHLEPVTQLENVRRGESVRTHCKRSGHEFTPENTYIRHDKDGMPHRSCATCGRQDQARRRQERNARDSSEWQDAPIVHGTLNAAQYYRCRCAECMAYCAKRKAELLADRRLRIDPNDSRHGKYSFYTGWGCRCEPCRQAGRDMKAKRKAVPA